MVFLYWVEMIRFDVVGREMGGRLPSSRPLERWVSAASSSSAWAIVGLYLLTESTRVVRALSRRSKRESIDLSILVFASP